MARKRDYAAEYKQSDGTPARKKARAERNKARRLLLREGKVKKGDGNDVHHKTPISEGGKTVPGNLAVVPAKKNRSFRRDSDGSIA